MTANANVDIKDRVRAGCSWIGADSVSVVLVRQYESTALHYAASNSSPEVAEALVAANANIDIEDWVSWLQLTWC